jgi:nitric oxide reductase subunit B
VVRVPLNHALRIAALALTSCGLALLTGLLSAIVYTGGEPMVRALGLTLQHLRPLHETLAFSWIFLGGVAVVYGFLHREFGASTSAMRTRMALQRTLWSVAGVGVVVSLLGGHFSGREYLGYSPLFSLLVAAGWVLFVIDYFSLVGLRLRGRPVYVYMWSVALPFFLLTYAEAHLYLLPSVGQIPTRDLAIQWKSNGTLVGSFNLLVYGSLIYISGLITGNHRYAHSRTAFALFFVGLLNTFTNYGHHTYHLPQSHWIHGISFTVSMLEILILAKVVADVVSALCVPGGPPIKGATCLFFLSASRWTLANLVLALAISVPPLNTLIHGTHVVVAHVMGSMIGIDSMILWGALWYIAVNTLGEGWRRPELPSMRRAIFTVNLSLAVFLVAFLARGWAQGWMRYLGPVANDLSLAIRVFPTLMMLAGVTLGGTLLWLLSRWIPGLLRGVPPAPPR